MTIYQIWCPAWGETIDDAKETLTEFEVNDSGVDGALTAARQWAYYYIFEGGESLAEDIMVAEKENPSRQYAITVWLPETKHCAKLTEE